MIDWTSVNEALPPTATRVLVRTLDGYILIGKLTVHGWLDDTSLPILNVEAWGAIR